MPMQDNIDVRILVNGEKAPEYPVPNAPDDEFRKQTRYIECKVGQRFAVEVLLLPGFDVRWAEAIHSSMRVDDEGTWSRGELTENLRLRCGRIRSEYCFHTLESTKNYDYIRGAWVTTAFEFGVLETSEQFIISLSSVTNFQQLKMRRQRRTSTKHRQPNLVLFA